MPGVVKQEVDSCFHFIHGQGKGQGEPLQYSLK